MKDVYFCEGFGTQVLTPKLKRIFMADLSPYILAALPVVQEYPST